MFPILAALVPSLGALLVAGDVLVEQVQLRAEHRVRRRVKEKVETLRDHLHKTTDLLAVGAGPVIARCHEYETRLLNLNGLEPNYPTYADMDLAVQMSAPLMPSRETVRQWVLLLTGLAGVALLAIGLA